MFCSFCKACVTASSSETKSVRFLYISRVFCKLSLTPDPRLSFLSCSCILAILDWMLNCSCDTSTACFLESVSGTTYPRSFSCAEESFPSNSSSSLPEDTIASYPADNSGLFVFVFAPDFLPFSFSSAIFASASLFTSASAFLTCGVSLYLKCFSSGGTDALIAAIACFLA